MLENVHEIILKVTRDCNLRCAYCYMRDKDRFRGERMSFDVFKQIIERYCSDQAKSTTKHEELRLIFHGGEPTLLDLREFIKFLNYAKSRIPYIQFGMQTNLTNISEELATVLQNYEISPGISIDGWGRRFNKLRMKKSRLLAKNIRLLEKYHVACAPLMVLTRENIKNSIANIRKVLKKFPNQEKIKANYVENIYTPTFSYPELTADELFNHFFLPTIKYFLKKKQLPEENTALIIDRFFGSILFELPSSEDADRVLGHCSLRFCAGGNDLVEVDPEGTICFCGRWDDVHAICTLGTINDIDLWGLSSYYKCFVLQKTKAAYTRKLRCDFCLAKNICDYGCIAFAYAKYKKISIREELVCAYYLKVIDYLKSNCSVLLEAYAHYKNWTISRNKRGFFLSFPPEAPKLNKSVIGNIAGWTIVDNKGQNSLQVLIC